MSLPWISCPSPGMKKLASAGMKLLEEVVVVISLQFGYRSIFGLEQFYEEGVALDAIEICLSTRRAM